MSKQFGSLDFSGPQPTMFGVTIAEMRENLADAAPDVRAKYDDLFAKLEYAATLVHGLDLHADA